MKLDGTHTFDAPAERVWAALTDPETLRRCTPGLKELRPAGEDRYEATIAIGIAAVKGTYSGTLALLEKQPPSRFRMVVEGGSGGNFVKGEGAIELLAQDGRTLLRWSGDAQVGGALVIGSRMIPGIARMLVGQFFKCIEGSLA